MAEILQETRVSVATDEVLEIRLAGGDELSCASGEVWITAEGNLEDIILGPGQNWRVPDNAKLAVSAFRPAVLLLRGVVPARRSPLRLLRAA